LKPRREDGSWNALDAIEALEIPSDLEEALTAYSEASKILRRFPDLRNVAFGMDYLC